MKRMKIKMTSFLHSIASARQEHGNSDALTLSQTQVRTNPKTQKPSLYKVFLLNDDYTPMEFVIELLESIFKKDHKEALRIMLHVHHKGEGLCGVYTFDVAETKVSQALQAARAVQHPLQCRMEKE